MEGQDLWMLSEEEVSRLGVSTAYKGYYYLIVAAVISVKTGLRKVSMYKEIYAMIAEMHEVTVISVEKDIRNCILKAWMDDSCTLRCVYPEHTKQPTNSEVIAYITSRLRLETATVI